MDGAAPSAADALGPRRAADVVRPQPAATWFAARFPSAVVVVVGRAVLAVPALGLGLRGTALRPFVRGGVGEDVTEDLGEPALPVRFGRPVSGLLCHDTIVPHRR